jgi:hypothetical protein
MDEARVDLVLQYVLASAGEMQGVAREVSATQMVKLAYLGDAAHAARHDGATFTGAAWTFSQLGPHDAAVEARVAPAIRRVGATVRGTVAMLEDDDLGHLRAAELALPAVVARVIHHALRTYARDTHGLLAHVYATAPMRRAKPGAAIDLAPVEVAAAVEPVATPAPLTPRQRLAMSARRAKGMAAAVRAAAVYAPRYDAVFVAGQAALDATERPLIACGGSLTIEDAAWDVAARRTRDVP